MSTLFMVIEGAKNELKRLRDERICDTGKLGPLARELDHLGRNPDLLAPRRFVDACKAVGIPANDVPHTVTDLIATLTAAGRTPLTGRRLTSAIEILESWYDIQCAHA